MVSSEIKASFHGHSPYSDGLSSVDTLCRQAAAKGFTYFGISDHDTVRGVLPLVNAIDNQNQHEGASIIPIQAVEIRAKEGDVILAIPGQPTNHDFLRWIELLCTKAQRPPLIDTIIHSVNTFQALVVIPHPDEAYLHSVSISAIKDLINSLDPALLPFLGLEVHNGACAMANHRTVIREIAIKQLAQELNLAQFGGADFDHVSQIYSQYTIFPPGNPSPAHFCQAIKDRKIKPSEPTSSSLTSWLFQALIFALSTAKDRLRLYA